MIHTFEGIPHRAQHPRPLSFFTSFIPHHQSGLGADPPQFIQSLGGVLLLDSGGDNIITGPAAVRILTLPINQLSFFCFPCLVLGRRGGKRGCPAPSQPSGKSSHSWLPAGTGCVRARKLGFRVSAFPWHFQVTPSPAAGSQRRRGILFSEPSFQNIRSLGAREVAAATRGGVTASVPVPQSSVRALWCQDLGPGKAGAAIREASGSKRGRDES